MDEALDIQEYLQPWITYVLTRVEAGSFRCVADTGIAYSLRQAQYVVIEEMTGEPISAENARLSFEETEELIGQLQEEESYGDHSSWYPHATPGPWAQAERNQLFDWLYSFISRYVDMPRLESSRELKPDRRSLPVLTVWRRLRGQSEVSGERLAELLSQEDGIEVDVPDLDPDGRQPLLVRLVRELPDGSPEALGLDIRLAAEQQHGRPPILNGRYLR